MRFAFAIYRYFPYGGLQCDMLRMAQEAALRGHEVYVFAHQWRGPEPDSGITVHLLPASGWSNHAQMESFGRNFANAVKSGMPFDAIVTFNRIPGGDLYFAADNCLAVEWREKHPTWLLRLFPRYRAFLKQEAEVFCNPMCRIMYITPRQRIQYQQAYPIPDDRFLFLPPGINPKCRCPGNAEEIRRRVRNQFGLADHDLMLILVGSNLQLKGGDRAIQAVAALPAEWRSRIRLFLVGNGSRSMERLSRKLGISGQTVFTGPRSDVPELLFGADLMVHPARSEATGTVLTEGLAAGLPVIASGCCGFSNYVAEIDPALVIPEPFRQEALNQILKNALEQLPELRRRALEYSAKADFFRRAAVAVDAMEECAQKR